MRTLGRLLVMALAVAATWLALPHLRELSLPAPTTRRPLPPGLLEQARTTPAVALRPGQSAIYPLEHQGTPDIKLLVHGELDPDAMDDPQRRRNYVLRLEWYGTDGERLHRLDYHARARLTLYRWRDHRVTRAFYAYRAEVLGNAAVIRFHDPRLKEARRLRVTLLRLDPELRGVVLRLYVRETLPEYKRLHRWQRLSPQFRSRIVKGSVYGPEYLTERERAAYVRQRWRPVGPERSPRGAARLLYLLDHEDLQRVLPPPPPAGLAVHPRLDGAVPVPGAGRLRLEFLQETDPPAGARVTLRWYGDRSPAPRTWTLTPPLTPWETEVPEGGTLEVTSGLQIHLRAFWNDRDITPKPLYSRTLRLGGPQELVYRLAALSETRRALRITCRRLIAERPEGDDAAPSEGPVTLLLEDDQGRPLYRHTLACRTGRSRYDRPAGAWAQVYAVTEPARGHLLVPRRAVRLRIDGPGDALVAVHTRAEGLVHTTRVPQDYAAFRADDGRRLAWFPLTPTRLEEWLRAGRVIGIHIRPRPPAPPPLPPGTRWNALEPAGPVPAKEVLVPAPAESGEPRAATYVRITAGREVPVRLEDDMKAPILRPRLVFTGRPRTPAQVSVEIDGTVRWSGRITATQGTLRLPPVRSGPHRVRVRVQGTAGDWYLGPVRNPADGYRMRTVYPIDAGGIEFLHHKQDPRTRLSVRLFLHGGAEEPARLRVRIEPRPRTAGRLTQGWSLTEREYRITPEGPDRLPLLPSRGQTMRMAPAAIIPLEDDLPPGHYRIRVRLLSPDQGYVALTAPAPAEGVRLRVLRVPIPAEDTP